MLQHLLLLYATGILISIFMRLRYQDFGPHAVAIITWPIQLVIYSICHFVVNFYRATKQTIKRSMI